MTTAEQIATGPYKSERILPFKGREWWAVTGPDAGGLPPMSQHDAERTRNYLNAAYTRGQQDRWIPVAMIHNDYDCSVRCSNCGDAGGFGVYDDLEWAKHCPGCGRPISEQVDAKGVRTPHPLYPPPNPEQRCGSEQ